MTGILVMMSKRINVLLPEKTIAILNRVAKSGNRSRFIDRAIVQYVETQGKRRLREELKAGYIANAERDRVLAEEWLPLDNEAWAVFEAESLPAKKRARAKLR